MKTVNLYEAKTHLSSLVQDALNGEEVIVAKNGTPLVRLTPVEGRKPSRAFGVDRDRVFIADDFDATPDDFADYT